MNRQPSDTATRIEKDVQRLREIAKTCRVTCSRDAGRSIDAYMDFWARIADDHEAMLSLLREAHEILTFVGHLLYDEPPDFTEGFLRWMYDIRDLCGWPAWWEEDGNNAPTEGANAPNEGAGRGNYEQERP